MRRPDAAPTRIVGDARSLSCVERVRSQPGSALVQRTAKQSLGKSLTGAVMGYVIGDHRHQATLLPSILDDYVDDSAPVRVVDAFVYGIDFAALGFERAAPASTARPGYGPRDLLKLYIYGYLNEVRSSRRLERECRHTPVSASRARVVVATDQSGRKTPSLISAAGSFGASGLALIFGGSRTSWRSSRHLCSLELAGKSRTHRNRTRSNRPAWA